MEDEMFLDMMSDRAIKVGHEPNETLIKLNILLVIYFHEKRYDEAMAEVTALLDNPDMAEYKAYLTLIQGQICELQGNIDETLRYYYRAFTTGKWSSYVRYYLWNHIGFCWLFKKKFYVTERFCRKAIKLDPNRGDAWKNLGVSLENQGKFHEAMGCYIKAFLLKIRLNSILRLRQLIWHTGMV